MKKNIIFDNSGYEKIKNKLPYNAIDFSDYVKNKQVYINSNKNSLSFSQYRDEEYLKKEGLNTLKEVFNLSCEELERKFNEAISGDGGEAINICTLSSSSLCAFLHFANVSKSNPLIIEIAENDFVEFDQVYFEVKNRVISKPSNMDVVLISKDEEDKDEKTILFLESKFSEYLDLSEKRNKISSKYIEQYEKYNNFYTYFSIADDLENPGNIVLYDNDGNEHFMEGVKQMLSHHIGLCNFITDKKSYDEKITLSSNCRVVLGEILFNGWYDFFSNYKAEYEKIYNVLTSRDDYKIKVMNKLLTYQDVFRDNKENIKLLNEKIRKFYKYD